MGRSRRHAGTVLANRLRTDLRRRAGGRQTLSRDLRLDHAGVLYGKAAQDCTPDEVATDLWEQIKLHVNKPGQPATLTDDILVSWNIDPGMILRQGHPFSEDPLVLPTAGTEQYRPNVMTAIPNLMLCGDYLNGSWEVANMEAACYNGRRATNAILNAASSHATPVATPPPYRPPEWEPLKQIDADRYANGQPTCSIPRPYYRHRTSSC